MVDGSFLNSFPSDSLLGRRATDLEDLEQWANDKEGLACSIVREFYGSSSKILLATTLAFAGNGSFVGPPVVRSDTWTLGRELVLKMPVEFLMAGGYVHADGTIQ